MTDLAPGPDQPTSKLNVGGVISATFGALRANFMRIFLFTFVLSFIPAILFVAAANGLMMTQLIYMGDTNLIRLFSRVVEALSYIPSYAGAGATVLCVVSWLDGNRAGLGACITRGGGVYFPLLLVNLLIFVVFAFALALLIVPAFYIATLIAVVAPVMAIERVGFVEAFRRSIALTQGNRWRVLLLIVVEAAVGFAIGQLSAFIAQGVLALYGGRFAPTLPISMAVLGFLPAMISIMVATTGLAALYHGLRTAKEGPVSRELAQVFD